MRISSITKNAGKACNNRLYRHIRTFEKIVKNYFVIFVKYEISYLFKERGKGVKLNERLLFNHFFNSGAGSASSVYPLVEAQAQRNR